MADIALGATPVAIAPSGTTSASATIAPASADPAMADPFASLMAALGEAAPVAAPVLPGAPTVPVATALPVETSDASTATDTDAPVATPTDDDAAPADTPLSQITAMLAFVPPPVVTVPVAQPTGEPAAATADVAKTAPAIRAGTTAKLLYAAEPRADAKAAAPTDAAPTAARTDAAATAIRLLAGGTAPLALATPLDPSVAVVATSEAPATATPAAVAPSAAPVRTDPPVATAAVAAAQETSERPRAARRDAELTPPDTSAPLIAPALPRTDSARVADAAAPSPAGTDAAIVRQLAVAQDGQWLDSLARDIAAIGSGDGQLRFRLDPDHLGALTVQITQSADGASLRLTASTEQARALIADAQPRLVAEARAQGLHLRETNVEHAAPAPTTNATSSGGAGGGGRNDGGLAGQLQQQQQQQQQQGGRRPTAALPDHAARTAPARPAATPRADLYA